MPTLLEKHHARKLHFATFGLLLFLTLVLIAVPLSNYDEKKVKEEFPKSLIEAEPNLNIDTEPEQAAEEQVIIVNTEPEQLAQHPLEASINIKWGSFEPAKLAIKKGTKVTWYHADDSKKFLIACYIGPNRVFKSENIFPQEAFSYTFMDDEEYLCIDAIYGARGFITVGSPKPKNSGIVGYADNLITGGVVRIDNLQYNPFSAPINLKFSLDPIKRMILSPVSFNALAMVAIVAFIVATIEYSIHNVRHK